MKYYSVDIQVEFEVPRGMPPQLPSDKPWRAVGYFQYFYCTERSKEKAKQLVLDFVRRHEDTPDRCWFKCDRIALMLGLTRREQIAFGSTAELTDEMFGKRDKVGIWFHTEKEYCVSESDYAASMDEENYHHGKEQDS